MTGGKPQVTGAGLWSETGAVELARSLDDWLSVGEDGTVTVYSGKVELGTGVRTALAQIVAEELDVPFESVHLVMGDTGRTPNEGYTAGSKTIQFGGNALRLAAAQARQILVELAAKRFGVSPDQVAVDGGLLWPKSRPEQRTTIAELSGGRRFERNIELTTLVKRPEEYRIVGSPLRRVEIPGKLFGTGSFIQDMKLPGMLHGR
ncbi:MAG TPA: molybdopterin cofactor-binding domain-containing protein, partial [Spirochaetia bacterium]|nr:molybdopterin cofactor-binding domain-containing protein [Spirochaetia bacterium]